MTEAIVNFFAGATHNDYLTLFLVSMVPVIELRGGMILSAGMNVNPVAAFFTCVAGSSVIIVPLMLLYKPLINRLKRTKLFCTLAAVVDDAIADKAQKFNKPASEDKNAQIKKFFGLLLFASVPLPFTGAWTGSAVAAILDVKVWKGALIIFLGNNIAALLFLAIIKIVPAEYIDIVLYTFLALVAFALLFSVFVGLMKYKKKKARLTPVPVSDFPPVSSELTAQIAASADDSQNPTDKEI
jgi:uncharacterized membrane protein